MIVGSIRPTNPAVGTMFYNIEKKTLKFFDGAEWREVVLVPK